MDWLWWCRARSAWGCQSRQGLSADVCGCVWLQSPHLQDWECSLPSPARLVPAGTSVLQLVETLLPEAPEGSNPRARADQNAGLGWFLREVELISTKMQEYVN